MWGPVIELADLRYRPDTEVNTIEALAESDPSEHAPFAEPIWTTTPEESGLGFVDSLLNKNLNSRNS